MIAPPQVQAHNLANAIRTDIGSTLFLFPPEPDTGVIQYRAGENFLCLRTQKKALTATPLTLNVGAKSREILHSYQAIWLTSHYGTTIEPPVKEAGVPTAFDHPIAPCRGQRGDGGDSPRSADAECGKRKIARLCRPAPMAMRRPQ